MVPHGRITDYFSKTNSKVQATAAKRKRNSTVKVDNGKQTQGESSTKRAKSATSAATSSNSTATLGSQGGLTRQDAIILWSDDLDAPQSSTGTQSSLVNSARPSQKFSFSYSANRKKPLLKLEIDLTQESQHQGPEVDSPLTPLPPGYESEPSPILIDLPVELTPVTPRKRRYSKHKGLTRLVAPIADFSTPRSHRTLVADSEEEDEGDRDVISRSPLMVGSSQSQYMSPTKGTPRMNGRHAALHLDDDDLVESSQTQERELDFRPSAKSLSKLRYVSETPELAGSLSTSSSFSQELPVCGMTLGDPEPLGVPDLEARPISPDNTGSSQRTDETQWPPASSPSSFPYHMYPQPETLVVASRSPSPLTGPPQKCDVEHDTANDADAEDSLPSSSIWMTQSLPLPDHTVVTASQELPSSCPPEIADIYRMFAADGSYPPDFPMSLRV